MEFQVEKKVNKNVRRNVNKNNFTPEKRDVNHEITNNSLQSYKNVRVVSTEHIIFSTPAIYIYLYNLYMFRT